VDPAARRRRTSSFGSFTRVVVIAVDNTDHSRHAFEWYLMNIWKNDDLIVFVHCPEAPKLPTFSFKSGLGPPVDEWKRILDEMNARSRQVEEDYEGTCAQKKLKYKMRIEAMKNIGEGVLRIAEEEAADIVICGTRNVTGKYGFKGSTCDFIMRNSSIPVVAVPTKY
jgi:nucleotide-binding universal stress UspA family protein